MDIGKENETITIEPAEEPVPKEMPAPERERETVPA